MSPSSKSISRLISFSAVVFPAPEGPTSMQISPAGIVKERSSTAGDSRPGYCLVTESKTISAPPPCVASRRSDGPSSWAVFSVVTERRSPERGPDVNALVLAEGAQSAHEHLGAEAGGAVDVGGVALDEMRRHLEPHADAGHGEHLDVDRRDVA